MDSYRESNQRLWDEWTKIHEGSDFYRLATFKTGTTKDARDSKVTRCIFLLCRLVL